MLTQTTPLMRKQLNPFGRYHFDLDRMRQTRRRLAAERRFSGRCA